MTKKIIYFLLFALVSMTYTSCSKDDDDDVAYDQALLIGKWHEGTDYYRYDNNGSGVTWDTSDDVTEAEGQKFTWTLVKSTLTHIHIMETTGEGTVPKVYTVTTLTENTLAYKDDYGNKHTFTRVL